MDTSNLLPTTPWATKIRLQGAAFNVNALTASMMDDILNEMDVWQDEASQAPNINHDILKKDKWEEV